MSSTASTFTSTSSSQPSQTQSNNNNNGNSPGSFYRNLFYILIGLLAAFGLVSFLSLMRARRRRQSILREAERLGVMVPGLPGYIPVRERNRMTWARPDGSESPDWWEISETSKHPSAAAQRSSAMAERTFAGYTGEYDEKAEAERMDNLSFQPLAIIPPPTPIDPTPDPPPHSALKYFPNHLAYRPSSLLPPPSRYQASDPDSLDALSGEKLEILTIIKMPSQPWPENRPVEETEEVIKEWNGVELGIVRVDVGSSSNSI